MSAFSQGIGNIQRTKPVHGCTCQRQSSWPRLGAVPLATAAIALLAVVSGSANAQTAINWKGDATSTDWALGSNWDGGNAPANDLTSNIARFNSATYAFQPTAPSNREVYGIEVGGSSGNVTLTTATGAGRLRLGAGGVTMESGAAAFSLGNNITQGVLIGADQTWTNNSASAFTYASIDRVGTGPFTLTLAGSGAGGFTPLGGNSNRGNVSLVVDYAGAGSVTLANAGTNRNFTDFTLKQGKVEGPSGSIGTGTITLGYNGGSSAILLEFTGGAAGGITNSTPIVLAAGHAGTITLSQVGVPNNNIGSVFTGGVTGTNNLILDVLNSSATSTSMRFDSDINITGNVTKRGVGSVSLSAANTFGGIALVEAGQLRLNHVNALQNATLDTGTAGAQSVTFIVAGTNTYNLGGLQGADALAIAGNTISVGANGGNTTFSGAISGTGGALTKTGIGRLTLASTNTYTGATSVQQGVLLVDGSTAAGSAVSVSSSAVFGGKGTVNGNLTLASGALFAFDHLAPNDPLDLGGTLTLNSSFAVSSLRDTSGAAVNWANVAQGTYTLMNTSFGFNTSNISNFGVGNQATGLSGGKTAYFQQGSGPSSLQLVVVPEPTALALTAAGAALSGLMAWRRRRG